MVMWHREPIIKGSVPANEGGCHGDVAQGTNNKGERIIYIGERRDIITKPTVAYLTREAP